VTPGSGARTGTTRTTTPAAPAKTLQALQPANTVCCAVARGPTSPGIAARPSATATSRATATAASASVSPALPGFANDLRFISFTIYPNSERHLQLQAVPRSALL